MKSIQTQSADCAIEGFDCFVRCLAQMAVMTRQLHASECMQPEVNEEFVRYFVQRVLFAETQDQPEQEVEPDENLLELQQRRLYGVVAEVCHQLLQALRSVISLRKTGSRQNLVTL